ncbi:MAG: type I-E CRISPR-associated protein Cas7/Cse4/CasC [Dehalococcoidia bacterium]|nr:type I-E CRISPR-associated protein Cas7/Cse4/CasC [Dehalococcoidia bacterium]
MLIELHIIQNFAPSNLNRDDTGSPKSCEFGGYRRGRISSQAIKRAIRERFKEDKLVRADLYAQRSKRFVEAIATKLAERGRDHEAASKVAEAGLGLLGIKLAREGKTEYLLYFAPAELDAIATFCSDRWDALEAAAGHQKAKKEKKDPETEALAKHLQQKLDGGKASDLALFGRMLADLPEKNIDAASQVAHAISTHPVSIEFDYYTAVDDLKPEDTEGADMIGTVEFNSACYYRYANIDLDQLAGNLNGDAELVAATVRAFLHASVEAIPTGKQNSFAARNAPSLVCTVVRERGAWSLANAFVDPVRARGENGLVSASMAALDQHWGELVEMYGAPAGLQVQVAALGKTPFAHLGTPVPVPELIEATVKAACP